MSKDKGSQVPCGTRSVPDAKPDEAPQLSEEEVKKLRDAYVEVMKMPTITGAFVTETANFIMLQSSSSCLDPAMGTTITTSSTQAILKSSLEGDRPVVISSSPATIEKPVFTVASNSGSHTAVLINSEDKTEDNGSEL